MFRCFVLAAVFAALVPASAWAGWDEASKIPLKRLMATEQIHLTTAPCPVPDAVACTELDGRPVTIFLPPTVPRAARARTYYHELGHAFDVLLLTDRDRRSLQRLMGNGDLTWFDDGSYITAGEQFADAFMLCAMLGPRSRSDLIGVLSDYDWTPSNRRYQNVCRNIIRLAR